MAAQGAREIHVFEPLAENADRIRSLIELNLQFDIRLHQCALGDHDGETELLVMSQTSMAKISMSGFQPTRMVTDRVRVRLARIDTLVANGELAPPNLIKMDVEGAEAFVVRGAMEVLRKYRPIVFAEIHSSTLLSECSSLLGELEYEVSVIDTDIDAARRRDVFQVRATPM
jgi:FkbM family methyltransferase